MCSLLVELNDPGPSATADDIELLWTSQLERAGLNISKLAGLVTDGDSTVESAGQQFTANMIGEHFW